MSLPGTYAPLLARQITPIGTPVTIGSRSATYSSGLTSGTMTTTGSIPAGSFVFVIIGVNANTPPPITAVSDGTNTYSLGVTVSGMFGTQAIWYNANAAAVGSGATITVTFTSTVAGAGNFYSIGTAYTTGIITTPLDQTASSGTTTATPSATTAALSQGNELVIGAAVQSGGTTFTEASGYSNLFNINSGTQPMVAGYKVATSTTAVTYNPTSTPGPSGTALVVATFKGEL